MMEAFKTPTDTVTYNKLTIRCKNILISAIDSIQILGFPVTPSASQLSHFYF